MKRNFLIIVNSLLQNLLECETISHSNKYLQNKARKQRFVFMLRLTIRREGLVNHWSEYVISAN